ncbi:MAG: hypothetical protein HDKAJFGB_03874 [Anaerolineae bacterium]|nr:hypothetical protein [Anaerolineae bacterium]
MRRKAFASELYLITPHHHTPFTSKCGAGNFMSDECARPFWAGKKFPKLESKRREKNRFFVYNRIKVLVF